MSQQTGATGSRQQETVPDTPLEQHRYITPGPPGVSCGPQAGVAVADDIPDFDVVLLGGVRGPRTAYFFLGTFDRRRLRDMPATRIFKRYAHSAGPELRDVDK